MTIHARHVSRSGKPQPAQPSELEALFDLQIRTSHLPRPQRELRLHPTRKWRYDYVWTDMLLVVEIEGHVHRIRERFEADFEKYAWLVLEGFTLLRIGGRQVRSGVGLQWLQRLVWERCPLGLARAYHGGDSPRPARLDASGIENRSHLDRAGKPVDNLIWATSGQEVYES